MTTQSVRPRGRRPGHDDTRGTIADAALALFDRLGYDATSLRAIARDADVDPALVHHYFTSKAHLFTSIVFDSDLDLVEPFERACADGEHATLGPRLARAFFDLWEHPRHRQPLTTLLHSGTVARRRLLAEFLGREVFGRVAASLGHGNAVLRGQLAASSLIGLMSGRHVLEMGALSTASARSLVDPVGGVLQHYLVEAW